MLTRGHAKDIVQSPSSVADSRKRGTCTKTKGVEAGSHVCTVWEVQVFNVITTMVHARTASLGRLCCNYYYYNYYNYYNYITIIMMDQL